MGFNFDLHSQILTTFVKKCQTLRDMCKIELHPRSENKFGKSHTTQNIFDHNLKGNNFFVKRPTVEASYDVGARDTYNNKSKAVVSQNV